MLLVLFRASGSGAIQPLVAEISITKTNKTNDPDQIFLHLSPMKKKHLENRKKIRIFFKNKNFFFFSLASQDSGQISATILMVEEIGGYN